MWKEYNVVTRANWAWMGKSKNEKAREGKRVRENIVVLGTSEEESESLVWLVGFLTTSSTTRLYRGE